MVHRQPSNRNPNARLRNDLLADVEAEPSRKQLPAGTCQGRRTLLLGPQGQHSRNGEQVSRQPLMYDIVHWAPVAGGLEWL